MPATSVGFAGNDGRNFRISPRQHRISIAEFEAALGLFIVASIAVIGQNRLDLVLVVDTPGYLGRRSLGIVFFPRRLKHAVDRLASSGRTFFRFGSHKFPRRCVAFLPVINADREGEQTAAPA